MDLDTVPENAHLGPWYVVTRGTWIGISDDWYAYSLELHYFLIVPSRSFVAAHVLGVSRSSYNRGDTWYECRAKLLYNRARGTCFLQ